MKLAVAVNHWSSLSWTMSQEFKMFALQLPCYNSHFSFIPAKNWLYVAIILLRPMATFFKSLPKVGFYNVFLSESYDKIHNLLWADCLANVIVDMVHFVKWVPWITLTLEFYFSFPSLVIHLTFSPLIYLTFWFLLPLEVKKWFHCTFEYLLK